MLLYNCWKLEKVKLISLFLIIQQFRQLSQTLNCLMPPIGLCAVSVQQYGTNPYISRPDNIRLISIPSIRGFFS